MRTEIAAAGYSVSDGAPRFTTESVVSAGLPDGTRLITIYGANLASETMTAPEGSPPVILGGTIVYINGYFAPLLYVSAGQINAQVPVGLPQGSVSLAVVSGTEVSAPVPVNISQP